MDEIHFAPPKNPSNSDCPVNTNKQWCQPWFQSGAKWISHPSTVGIPALQRSVFLLCLRGWWSSSWTASGPWRMPLATTSTSCRIRAWNLPDSFPKRGFRFNHPSLSLSLPLFFSLSLSLSLYTLLTSTPSNNCFWSLVILARENSSCYPGAGRRGFGSVHSCPFPFNQPKGTLEQAV